MPLLQISHLDADLTYGFLFHDLNFSVDRGECIWITGANGAGKTTLLKILCGLQAVSAGDIFWQNDVATPYCYIGHRLGLYDHFSVCENLQFYATLWQSSRELEPLLAEMGLYKIRRKSTHLLSAGQRQRLALARLALSPAVCWLLDEPNTALDQGGCALLTKWIEDHLARKGAVIMTAHQPLPLSTREITLGKRE